MILRELFVKLGLDVDEAAFAKGQLAASLVEAGVKRLAKAAVEAVESFVQNVQQVAQWGETVQQLSQQAGISTDSLQRLGKAAAEQGIGIDDFAHSMVLLSRTMAAAKGGGEEQGKVFSKLGVKLTDAHGKLRGADDVFGDISEKFHKLPDGAEKTAAAMHLFGRSGASLIPVLNEGKEGLERFKDATVMTPEQIRAGKEVIVTQRRIADQTRALWREAIGPLLPAIGDLLKRYLAWKKANGEIMKQRIREYVGYVIKAIGALGDAFDFLVKNAAGLKLILIPVFGLIALAASEAAVRTLAAWALAAAPFILIGSLIAAMLLLFDDFRVYQAGGKSLFGLWKKTIDDWLAPKANDVWFLTAIKDFVRLLKDALRLIDEFNEATGRVAPKKVDERAGIGATETQRRADVMTQKTARQRVAMGLPLTDEERLALERSGVTEDAFVQKYGTAGAAPELPPSASYAPELPRGGGARAPVVNSQSVQINVTQQPGQNSEDLARTIQEQLSSHWDNQMESTAAAVE